MKGDSVTVESRRTALVWDMFSDVETLIMTRNEGNLDRALRIIAGLALISLVFIGPQTPWGWIGLVPLVTGLVGMCPLYSILGHQHLPDEEGLSANQAFEIRHRLRALSATIMADLGGAASGAARQPRGTQRPRGSRFTSAC
jgi:hypothetical protein